MTAGHSFVSIICAHDRSGSGIDTCFKMRQKHFSFRPFAAPHRNFKSGIFHRIKRKMLHTGNNAFALYSLNQRVPHMRQQTGIFSICFLGPAPARVIRQIHTDSSKQVAASCDHFLCHCLPHSSFQIRIKSCPSHRRHRETDRLPASAYYAPCAICKEHRWNPFFFHSPGSVGIFIIVGFHLALNSSSNAFFGFTAAHKGNLFFKCKRLKYLTGPLCIRKPVCSPFIHPYVSFSDLPYNCPLLFFPVIIQDSLYNCFYL